MNVRGTVGRLIVGASPSIVVSACASGTVRVGDPGGNDPSCKNVTPQDLYQTAQLWYSMLHWAQPGATCFSIVNTAIR